ncbi:MAG TPA: hypothetical protein VKX17_14200 [Planctomycetota bacterium]|nr:hypothetical protein [Planctomycetota bacterium]
MPEIVQRSQQQLVAFVIFLAGRFVAPLQLPGRGFLHGFPLTPQRLHEHGFNQRFDIRF